MNVSYNWLKEYINTTHSPEQLAEILTETGLEVGSIKEFESIKGGLKGLVIGKVLTKEQHPGADRLNLTTVDIGAEAPLSIVCGAPNIDAGQTVVVATVGTTLYAGDESFKIKKSKIRGEVSMGMICSESEIGVGQANEGIMVLQDSIAAGTPAKDYFQIKQDHILEVDLTPNRIDGASHIGVARDIAAYLSSRKQATTVLWPSVDSFTPKPDNHSSVSVSITNNEACLRFSGVSISNVKVAESPTWLQDRLRSIGLRPINNIVDITNFVLHECAQPLHAYDSAHVEGKLVIQPATEGNSFITLDNQERKLSDRDLMITNGTKDLCVAGVMGGVDSGVTESTTNIFLESACFNPVWVRKTSRRHGIHSDSSFRFERGTDPNNTLYALKRAALLIEEIAGGTISSEIVDIYPNPVPPTQVKLHWLKLDKVIGQKIEPSDVKIILASLDIEIVEEHDDFLLLNIPTYRVDVTREIDVIEEVLRIYGYNNIEISSSVKSTLVYSNSPNEHKSRNTVADMLSAQGFNEIMCNSLTKGSYYEDSADFNAAHSVQILNPLSSELNVLRQSMLFGGLETIAYNLNRKINSLKIYEFGNTYSYDATSTKTNKRDSYTEYPNLALWITGDATAESWYAEIKASSFYDLKAYVENTFARIGIKPSLMAQKPAPQSEAYAEAIIFETKEGKQLAQLGLLNTKTTGLFGIKQPVYYAELNWKAVLNESVKNHLEYKSIPKFPQVRRDLSLLLDKGIGFSSLRSKALEVEKRLLIDVSLFDVYEGDKLPDGKKSYALSFILQDEGKTLTDKRIDKVMSAIQKEFESCFNAQLR